MLNWKPVSLCYTYAVLPAVVRSPPFCFSAEFFWKRHAVRHHAVKQYVVATFGCEASGDRYYKLLG